MTFTDKDLDAVRELLDNRESQRHKIKRKVQRHENVKEAMRLARVHIFEEHNREVPQGFDAGWRYFEWRLVLNKATKILSRITEWETRSEQSLIDLSGVMTTSSFGEISKSAIGEPSRKKRKRSDSEEVTKSMNEEPTTPGQIDQQVGLR